jgi:hypothetical protein
MIKSFRGEFGFLSNMHSCPVEYEGIKYPSSEHAYQACKFIEFFDRQHVASMKSPVEAKRFPGWVRKNGLIANHPMDPDFDKHKLKIMKRILDYKFKNNPDLGRMLVATMPEQLIESGWWHDGFWGTCTCGKCAKGQNNLGNLLMRVRSEILEAS